jgi:hypothetical protein
LNDWQQVLVQLLIEKKAGIKHFADIGSNSFKLENQVNGKIVRTLFSIRGSNK